MSRVLKSGEIQITCTYREHWDKFSKNLTTACGVDIVKKTNQCEWIVAHTDGTVVKVVDYLDGTNRVFDSENCAYGNYVAIEHKGNIVTVYAHMEKVQVKEGQKVSRGDVLGFMGNTGNSYGAHLHFEVRSYLKPLSQVYINDIGAYEYLNAQAYIDIDLPAQTPTSSNTTENLYKNTIPERFKVVNKDGKTLNTYTSLENAENFARQINGTIVDRLLNKEIAKVEPKLSETSYPDYTDGSVYRVRTSFKDNLHSVGSFSVWGNAYHAWLKKSNKTYHIYDKNGKQLD